MFATICFEHWNLCYNSPMPTMFDMFSCTVATCSWCELRTTLFNYKVNRRFKRSIERYVRNQSRRLHFISEE
jgi:hypothetical protein